MEQRSAGSLYLAERMKYRHTLAGKMGLWMPLLTLALAYAVAGNYGLADGYNWWYVFLLPGSIILFTCLLGQKDKKLKNRAVLSLPEKPERIWDAKILTGMRMVVIANGMLSILSLLIGNQLLPVIGMEQAIEVSWKQGIAAMVLMSITMFWMIPATLWMEQKFGLFAALVVQLCLSMTGLFTSVGSWWFLNPYGILQRLMCSVLKILPNGLKAEPGSMTFTPELLETNVLLPGILLSLLWFVVLWGASRRWYGKKGVETV